MIRRPRSATRPDTLCPSTTLFRPALRQALVLGADREVPDDFGDLVDVAALQLLDVVLEAARPVRGHPRLLLAEDSEHLLDLFVVDDVDRKSTRLNSSH